MVVEVNIFALVPVVIAIYYIIRWSDEKLRQALGVDAESRFLEKIAKLQDAIDNQQASHRRELDSIRREHESKLLEQKHEFDRRVAWLVEQLQDEGAKVKALEIQSARDHPLLPAKPLLLICGISQFCAQDRMAIRRAGIPFHRILDATKTKIEDEFRRRRSDGTLYKWVHVNSHASADGVQLSDGMASATWWNETLIGIEVLFLAACETVEIADALAGMMTVVSTTEEILDKDAADFTYIFWRQMREHGNPGRAYQEALLAVPQVSEFTDIRLGGDNYGSDNE